MARRRTCLWGVIVGLAALGIVGCFGGDDGEQLDVVAAPDVSGCEQVYFPEVDVEGAITYVADCAADGTGSRESPFRTPEEAYAVYQHSNEGGTIVVAPGTYPVLDLTLGRPVSIIGSGSTGEQRTLFVGTGKQHVIRTHSINGIVLRDFAIEGNVRYGLDIYGSLATLQNVHVSGVGRDGTGAGIHVEGSSGVDIGATDPDAPGPSPDGVVVTDARGYGIHVVESLFSLSGSTVKNAQSGGLYVVDSLTIGQRYEIPDIGTMRGNEFLDNDGFGVRLEGGEAQFEANLVSGTTRLDETETAPCLAIVKGAKRDAEPQVIGNTFTLCDGEGIRLSHSAFHTVIEDNAITDSSGAGIWLEDEARGVLRKNTISAVSVAGIFATPGATLSAHENIISSVSIGHVWGYYGGTAHDHAFGIAQHGEMKGGDLYIIGNQVSGCELAGIVVRSELPPNNHTIENNVVVDNGSAGAALEGDAVSWAESEEFASWFLFESAELGLSGNGPTGKENVVLGSDYLPELP